MSIHPESRRIPNQSYQFLEPPYASNESLGYSRALPPSKEVKKTIREKNAKRCRSRLSKFAKLAGMTLMGVGTGMVAAGTAMFLIGLPLSVLYGSGIGVSVAGVALGLGGVAVTAVGALLASSAKNANGEEAMSGADWQQCLVPGLGVAKAVKQGLMYGVGDYSKTQSLYSPDPYMDLRNEFLVQQNKEVPTYKEREDRFQSTSIFDDGYSFQQDPSSQNPFGVDSPVMPSTNPNRFQQTFPQNSLNQSFDLDDSDDSVWEEY